MEPTKRFDVARCEGIVSLDDGSIWRPVYIRIPKNVILGDPVADARLISSAPELYSAINSLVDLLETTELNMTGRTPTEARRRIQVAVELLEYIQGKTDVIEPS